MGMVIRRYPSLSSSLPAHQRYELIDNNEKFELKVDVPGVKEENLDIKIDDGKITVEGQRMTVSSPDEASGRFTSKFSKTFSLDRTVDVDKFTASLNNGVLVVSAPKDLSKLEESIRRIPITAAAASIAEDTVVLEGDAKEGVTEEHSKQEEEKNVRDKKEKVEIQEAETKVENDDTIDLDVSSNA